ncbi:MAG: glutamate racemase [Gemmatimonadales bacterium]|nr:glutamate racemase [Gemmatimonadales bacterium]
MEYPDPRQPIGVFDSGLGGLTVLRAVHERLPAEDLVYFGDTARVPYGTKGALTVRNFARQDAGLLVKLGVKLVIVACNTASAFALEHLQETMPVPVIGVITPGVLAALRRTRGGPVGVIGTSGTIRSGRYQEGLRAGAEEAVGLPGLAHERILVQECPLFVPLVEEGMMGHPITRLALEEYLEPLKKAGVDTLILGCTHYPLLKEDISAYMGPGVELVDSADTLAVATEELLDGMGLLRPDENSKGELSFHLSDIPWKFAEIGARFLGKSIAEPKIVGLDEMEQAGKIEKEGSS